MDKYLGIISAELHKCNSGSAYMIKHQILKKQQISSVKYQRSNNPKHQISSIKYQRNNKYQVSNVKEIQNVGFKYWNFEFRYCLELVICIL